MYKAGGGSRSLRRIIITNSVLYSFHIINEAKHTCILAFINIEMKRMILLRSRKAQAKQTEPNAQPLWHHTLLAAILDETLNSNPIAPAWLLCSFPKRAPFWLPLGDS